MISIVSLGKPENSEREDEVFYELQKDGEGLFSFQCDDKRLSVILMNAANAACQHEQLYKIMEGDKIC